MERVVFKRDSKVTYRGTEIGAIHHLPGKWAALTRFSIQKYIAKTRREAGKWLLDEFELEMDRRAHEAAQRSLGKK